MMSRCAAFQAAARASRSDPITMTNKSRNVVGRVTPCVPFVEWIPVRRARSDAPYPSRSETFLLLC